MDHRMILSCWQVLTIHGWRDFTLHHVHDHFPQYVLHELETLFPTHYHVVTAYSQSQVPNIPLPDAQAGQDLNEALFQSVIGVIEFWWPYRDIIMYAILDMPMDLSLRFYAHVAAWMYRYWAARLVTVFIGPFVSGPKGMVILSLVVYVWIFPYALTHSLEETWVRLDQSCTIVVNFLKKSVPDL